MAFTPLFALIAFFGLMESSTQAAELQNEKIFAVVSKVEGSGTARVRRVAGTESVAGEQMEIYAGDRILTDDASTVDVLLQDGTILRVGIRSEFRLTEVELKKGALAWLFGLGQGAVRALIEKSTDRKNVKLRISTPAGTMGVRGTEILIEHRKESGLTTLYTLDGEAEFGAPGCDKNKNCVSVGRGNFSQIKAGAKQPLPPKGFTMKEVLNLPASSGIAENKSDGTVGGGDKDPILQRLALFQGVARANTGLLAGLDEGELRKAVKVAQDNLQNAQDQLLGRTEEIRRAMYAAMSEGTYEQVLKLADAYLSIKGEGATGDTKPLLVGPEAVRRFVLGKVILESSVFGGGKASATPMSDEAITALVGKGSPSLERAAVFVEAAAKKEPIKSAEEEAAPKFEPKITPVIRELSTAVPVQAAVQELALTKSAVSNNLSSDCGTLCAIGKLLASGGTSKQATNSSSVKAKKVSKAASAKMATCAHPITTCTYQPCDTRTGKVCKKEKVCKQTCQ